MQRYSWEQGVTMQGFLEQGDMDVVTAMAKEAGKAKRLGNLPPNYENEVLSHFIADMAQQIDRSLQFFFAAASRHNVIDQLILGGGCGGRRSLSWSMRSCSSGSGRSKSSDPRSLRAWLRIRASSAESSIAFGCAYDQFV